MDSANSINQQGVAHCQAGRIAEGLTCFQEAARLEPDNFEFCLNLGHAFSQLGQWPEAEAALGRAHAISPARPDLHRAMAQAYAGQGRTDELVARYRQAVADRPGDAILKRNAAVALAHVGRRQEALPFARDAFTSLPKDTDAGLTLASLVADHEEAERILIAVLTEAPSNAQAGYQLGLVRSRRGLREAAAATFEMVLRLAPDHVEALRRLADIRLDLEQLSEAIPLYRRLLEKRPIWPEVQADLATALARRGNIPAAMEGYRAALAAAPDNSTLREQYCFLMNLLPSATRAEIFEAHREWGRRHGEFPRPAYANTREPERRLKVGYVSPDFCEHSVAYFFGPLLEAHDRGSFEIFCYATGQRKDEVTEQLRSKADHWRSFADAGDAEAFSLVRDDGIDILVDLAGHSAANRLGLFARAPAPVEITWLGYPETTGVPAIQYKLTDAIVSPPEADRYASEQLIRLPDGYHCYRAPPGCPDVAPSPGLRSGHITFGHFNGPPKLNPEVIGLWCAVLRSVPDSHMVIKGRQFGDEAVRDRYTAMFGVGGIAPERLALLPSTLTAAEHLAQYALMDICLDTHPYSGTTTICEALWMGVPVVTLMGERAASRVGGSVLSEAGLSELVAENPEAFIRIAVDLARDPARLNEMRSGMRRRLEASPLRDERGFARKIEATYRDVWRRWCEGEQAG